MALPALLALLFSGMPMAQDGASGNGGEPVADDETPQVAPLERVFIQSGSGQGALAQRYPHLAVWLEPEDSPRVLALVERESAGQANGAVIIIGDEGDSANAPLLAAMREKLTEAGWAAMTLGMDSPSLALQQARDHHARSEDEKAAGQPQSDGPVMIDVNSQAVADLLQAHRDSMNAVFEAATGWLAERGYQEIVLVGIGRGAAAVHGYLPQAPSSVRRAAWVAADFGRQTGETVLEGLSAVDGLALLDLYSSRGSGIQDRKAAFSRRQWQDYTALPVPTDPQLRALRAGSVVNRLVGWLMPSR
ncbi:Protein of unknown function [Marinobacter daqiaonensis]|uniref:DUF3530 domain-containing protein n=1 Tax=Marinobacter daqiaonensis TaxID=650891 RepID=A0A1I6JST3_9GAMM|nr:DUF3530 family protein [Marinobacter daqiaonensis]SFR82012.1 Protein of unknown function [Marinobacter daqiaonensis]